MIVVSDTSPITNLAQINRLDLLPKLYGAVTIPQTVANELARFPHSTGFNLLALVPWLTVRAVHDTRRVASFRLQLDQGESEALVLCQELQADLLLIDERKERRPPKRAFRPPVCWACCSRQSNEGCFLPSRLNSMPWPVSQRSAAGKRWQSGCCGKRVNEKRGLIPTPDQALQQAVREQLGGDES